MVARRLGAAASTVAILAGAVLAGDWPGWRGPRGDGRSDEAEAPARWGPKENIAWRVEVPGTAHSSPIVVGDALFVTTATGEGKEARRLLLRYHLAGGSLAWEREVVRAPLEGKHFKNSHASGTPASDGERVYTAFLAGRKVHVAAVGLDGRASWEATPCGFRSVHGFCSSPVLHQGLVIVNCDQDSEEAALYAFEGETGEVRWRAGRENHVRSYVTPLIAEIAGKPRLFLSGSQCVTAYDPANGKRVWVCDGPTEQCVASPVFGEGLVFITGGYPGREILAIRPDGRGDVTRSHVAWRSPKGVAYVPSPLFAGGRFYVVHDETGVLSAYDARTGKLDWQERLGGKFSSSLTLAAGRIYLASEDGEVHVVAPGPRFERVALNRMGEGIFASPAVAGGRIYLRTTRALYAIGAKAIAAAAPEPTGTLTGSEDSGDGGAPPAPETLAEWLKVLAAGALPDDSR
ncbi:MAG: PQQ-binding-like beta-propeller repeat protein, partial [Thermoanaerobaculia bacterium]